MRVFVMEHRPQIRKVEMETSADERGPQVNRRELLSHAWLASIALFMGEMGVVTYLFALPRFREGEFGGTFTLEVAALPPLGSAPENKAEAGFWLANTDEGLLALYKVCTHLGCLYKWVDANTRFECPCHGSKFEIDGTYIEGPAPRDLDRFAMTALDSNGNELARSADGAPLPLLEGTANVRVDTGDKILGRAI